MYAISSFLIFAPCAPRLLRRLLRRPAKVIRSDNLWVTSEGRALEWFGNLEADKGTEAGVHQ